jgi:hypothetical protein
MTKHKRGRRTRHVPERTCIACRAKRPKRELVRVVHTPAGEVRVDELGKLSGRGAYLCPRLSCWERALERGALGRALRVRLEPQRLEVLKAYAATLSDSDEEG